MPATASGADALANTLLASLTSGVDFDIPNINLTSSLFNQPPATGSLYDEVTPISFEDLTTGQVNGEGVFDKIMSSLVAHLKVEYSSNRISGAEYTRAYIGMIEAALQTAQQFLLTKDQAHWQSILAQAQARAAEAEAVRARLELETARVTLARAKYEAAIAEVTYGLTKIKIASEDVTYSNLVKQGDNLSIQTDNLEKQGVGIDYTNTFVLPKQVSLLKEQVEVQRAQTSETRTDGFAVNGLVGKQKDLYTQQIISYQRDAETKAAKLWADAFVTIMTITDGGTVPNEFNNTNISEVMAKLKNNLDLS